MLTVNFYETRKFILWKKLNAYQYTTSNMFQNSAVREVPIFIVNVDNEGIISVEVPNAYEGRHYLYLHVST